MWKWINSFAQPEKAYGACNFLMPFFVVVLCVCLPIGIMWGLVFAPTDYQQFDVYRIIYIHVPSASLSLTAYMAMAVAAFVGIVWQWRSAFTTMIALAPIGAVVCFISLFTGAVWGKPTWGTYWIWDARLTSQLILLFLYLGVIALYVSFDDKQQGAKASAVMAMVGVINIPIIKYSVEWWNTLHQPATISKLDEPSMPAEMAIPLLIAMVGMAGYIGTVTLIRMKNELIKRDAHRPWVAETLEVEEQKNKPFIRPVWWAAIALLLVIGAFFMYQQGAKFDSFASFIDMGGRGFFVWLSFSVSLVAMLVLLVLSVLERKTIINQASKQKKRVERIMEARAAKAAKKAVETTSL
ncbi:MAG: heme exporter protein C [Alphaproteobacteria bacterium]|jgi:heme exporter protein C